jgi:hypothetical protein
MNINRDNYENWLLLYIDRELNAADKEAFEAFAAANPDVQEELNLYLQTILSPDEEVCFAGKANLLQPELWDANNLTPVQEALIEKLEQTLDAAALGELDRQIAADVLLQKEWELLKQTKLQAEIPAQMPNKASLYRQQAAKVLPLKWLARVSAAAAILVSGWFWMNNSGNNEVKQTIASVNNDSSQVATAKTGNSGPSNIRDTVAPEGTLYNSSSTTETAGIKNKTARINTTYTATTTVKSPSSGQQTLPAKDQATTGIFPADMEERPEAFGAIAKTIPLQEVLRSAVNTPLEHATIQLPVEKIQVQLIPDVQVPVDKVPAKGVAATDWDNDTDNDVINIAGVNIIKQRLRGIYRHVTRPIARVFEKKPDNVTLAAR